MSMQLTTAEQIIVHVLGRNPPAAWPTVAIVNLAWQNLLDVHDWRWAAGTRVTLDLVAGQARYTLPENLGHIIRLRAPESWNADPWMVSWAQLEEARSQGTLTFDGQAPYRAAVRWTEQEGGEHIPELELYPVPSTDQAGGIEVSYLPGAGAPHSGGDDLSLPCPPFMDPLWVLWLRAWAAGLVEHDIAGVDERLASLAGGLVMMTAIKRDAGPARRISPKGGAATEGGNRRPRVNPYR